MANKSNRIYIFILFIFILSLFFFSFIFNTQPVKATTCGATCNTISDGCSGIWVCYPPVEGQPQDGYCKKNDSNCGGGGGDGSKCGDKICNGNETSATCPADCAPITCVPNCKDKFCGDSNGCGKFCAVNKCQDKTKVCDPNNYKCVKPDGCTDTDMNASDPYFVKGTVIDKSAKKFTDHCEKDDPTTTKDESNTLMEYWCAYDGTVGGDPHTCDLGCKDGKCTECKQDSDCFNSANGKYCDTQKSICVKTQPAKCSVSKGPYFVGKEVTFTATPYIVDGNYLWSGTSLVEGCKTYLCKFTPTRAATAKNIKVKVENSSPATCPTIVVDAPPLDSLCKVISPPNTTPNTSKYTVIQGQEVTFSANVPKEDSPNDYSYIWKGGCEGRDSTCKNLIKKTGSLSTTVYITDKNNNVKTGTCKVVVIPPPPLKIISCSVSEESVIIGKEVTFDAKITGGYPNQSAKFSWEIWTTKIVKQGKKSQKVKITVAQSELSNKAEFKSIAEDAGNYTATVTASKPGSDSVECSVKIKVTEKFTGASLLNSILNFFGIK